MFGEKGRMTKTGGRFTHEVRVLVVGNTIDATAGSVISSVMLWRSSGQQREGDMKKS